MKIITLLSSIILLTSMSFGQTVWHEIESNTSVDLLSIDFVTDQIGYIGGTSVLLKTVDGGLNWNEVQIDSINAWAPAPWIASDVDFFTEDHGRMVLEGYASLVETFDGGQTWTSMQPASGGLCYFGSIFFFDENSGFVGGHGCFEAAIIDRFDSGTWESTSIPFEIVQNASDLVNEVEFHDEMNGLAVTNAGRIFLTSDGGFNWDTIPNPESMSNLTDIVYLTADSVYVTYDRPGGFGTLISTEGGLSWETDWETATFFYPSMFAAHVAGGTPYFGGVEGNAGEQGVLFDKEQFFWSYQAVDEPIRDIGSRSDSIVFAVGDNGAIYVNVDPIALSIDDFDIELISTIYPNPTSDRIQFTFNSEGGQIESIQVFDLNGKALPFDYLKNGLSAYSVDVSHLASGTYILEVVSAQGRFTEEFMVD